MRPNSKRRWLASVMPKEQVLHMVKLQLRVMPKGGMRWMHRRCDLSAYYGVATSDDSKR